MCDSAGSKANFLRLDLLQPLDVVLSRGRKPSSLSIKAVTLGKFSHAALVVWPTWWLEADGYGVLRAPKQSTCVGWYHNEPVYLLDVGNRYLPQVMRHPSLFGLNEVQRGDLVARFSEVRRELEDREYPVWERLVDATRLPCKPAFRWLARIHDRIFYKHSPVIPGNFCSELVAEIFSRLGIKLFSDDRPASHVSPNGIAKMSLLKPLDIIGAPPLGFREDPKLYETLAFAWNSPTRAMGAKLVRGRAFTYVSEQEVNRMLANMDDLVRTIMENNARTADQLKRASK